MHKVLVVHNPAVPLDTFRHFFAQSGYHVETATSGEHAIAKLDRVKFDLVIMDLRPPGIDGSRIARHMIHSASRHSPVIAICPTPMPRQYAFDLVLSNPLDIMLLRGFLRTIPSKMPSGADGTRLSGSFNS